MDPRFSHANLFSLMHHFVYCHHLRLWTCPQKLRSKGESFQYRVVQIWFWTGRVLGHFLIKLTCSPTCATWSRWFIRPFSMWTKLESIWASLLMQSCSNLEKGRNGFDMVSWGYTVLHDMRLGKIIKYCICNMVEYSGI